MKTKYQTELYEPNKGLIYLWTISMIFLALLIVISIWLNIFAIALTGFICVCILPFFFEKKIKQFFIKKLFIELDETSFSITTYSLKKDNLIGKHEFLWTDVKSYAVYFSPAKNTVLTINFWNGSKKRWSFKENKNEKEAINSESAFSLFYFYIKEFNMENLNKKIVLTPGFLATKSGNTFLIILICLLIAAFILHLSLHAPSSFLSLLMSVSITFQLFVKRKQQKSLYEKLIKLEIPANEPPL
jgi:hypothetical protein